MPWWLIYRGGAHEYEESLCSDCAPEGELAGLECSLPEPEPRAEEDPLHLLAQIGNLDYDGFFTIVYA